MRLLLDTCTFLWLVEGGDKLSETARGLFRDPANEVFLSAVSAWEISVKSALGRLPLPEPADRFVPSERERLQVKALPLEEAAALQLGRLPPLHRDPFDRMLVCQAISESMTILTPDEDVRQYPVRTAW